MFKVITAAALLSWGLFVPVQGKSISQVSSVKASEAIMLATEAQIPDAILTVLLEEHAANHWGLTPSQAWSEYNNGSMAVLEIEAGSVYRIEYTGGSLLVNLEDGSF